MLVQGSRLRWRQVYLLAFCSRLILFGISLTLAGRRCPACFGECCESIRQVAKVEESYIEPEVSPEFETQDNTMSVGDDSTAVVDPEATATDADTDVQVIKGNEVVGDDTLAGSDANSEDAGSEALEAAAPQHAKPSLVYEWNRS